MTFYLTTFLVWGALVGMFYHFVTRQTMRWWPDTAIIGSFFGALAVITIRLATSKGRAFADGGEDLVRAI